MEIAQAEVTRTAKSMPRELREEARRLPLTFEPRPSDEVIADGIAADTLGLFVGAERSERSDSVIPSQIILYLENIWEMVEGDETDFREEVRITWLHELGHYLGLDEEELTERGLE